ncbi:MAG: chemotaxis protein CheW [Alphaproteobacteria bacterium]|nr:chemotaxis protein CheW [Alphaproteobacteria bacterium]
MTAGRATLDEILTARHGKAGEVVNVNEPLIRLVIFSLDGDWFAFHGEQIREILADCHVFFLPGCPPSMEGVINVRGEIESVIRLRSVLRYSGEPETTSTRILIGQGRAMRSGLRVDRVEDVASVFASRMEVPPHNMPDHLATIVQGILSFGEHHVSVLDLDRLFDDYRAGLR